MVPVSVGTIIAGRYRVVALIGEGSMGVVYRVEHLETGETLALKLLHGDLGRHPEMVARLEREAIAASRIDHPNVVHATDFGCSADGSFFVVLEFLDGRDLRTELEAGRMDAARAINVMGGAVAGIRAAHEKGVIHRDLKPENIMLVEHDGNRDFVKLLDFGIARLDNPQSGMQPLTIAGTPLGTPAYMSPEQVLGRSVDARSDLYSLGVIFFELLTGSCPFAGDIARLLQQHLTAEPPELPPAIVAQNPGLARIVRMLLAKAPKNRFQAAGELAEALHAAAAGQAGQRLHATPIPPQPESRTLAALAMQASLARKRLVGMSAPPASRRLVVRRRGVIVALCCAAVLLVIVIFAATRDGNAPLAGVPGPSATARPEPSRLDPRAHPSGKSMPPPFRTRGK